MNSERHFYKWELVILFWLAYFLNQGGRQIFNAVLPLLKTDLHVSDVQLGGVVTAFTMVYGVLVLFAGFLGDMISRKKLICLSLVTFSVGTLLTGFSFGLVTLFIFRSIATGAGEALYYPPATSLLAHHHQQTRAQALSIHQTSLYVGIAASSWLAAWLGVSHGWRVSFYLFGIAGIILAVVMALRMSDDAPPSQSIRENAGKPNLREALGVVAGTRTLWYLSLAFGGTVFVTVGYVTWMPTFLYEKFHLSLQAAAFNSVSFHLAGAIFGVMLGARISDRFAARRRTVRMEIEYASLILGCPFVYLLGASSNLWLVYVSLGAFGVFRGMYDSNLFAAPYDVIPPRYHSSATGIMLALAFIVGAMAPLVLGVVKAWAGLDVGLSGLSVVYLASGLLILAATKLFFHRDYYIGNSDKSTISILH
jgi:MFS family permease